MEMEPRFGRRQFNRSTPDSFNRQLRELYDADCVTGEQLRDIIALARDRLASRRGDPAVRMSLEVNTRFYIAMLSEKLADADPSAKTCADEFLLEFPEFTAGKYRFSTDWFSSRIEEFFKCLSHFAGQPHLRFIEIGCFEGRCTTWLLDNILTHPTSRITCIDVFSDRAGRQSYSDTFDRNVDLASAAERVTKIKGRSQEVLRGMDLGQYDFLYIDGSHKAKDVLEDAMLGWPLLKQNGLLMFDDYPWDHAMSLLDRPKKAIDVWLELFAGEYALVHKDWTLCVRRVKERAA